MFSRLTPRVEAKHNQEKLLNLIQANPAALPLLLQLYWKHGAKMARFHDAALMCMHLARVQFPPSSS